MNRPAYQWARLQWPKEVTTESVGAAFRSLNGLTTRRRHEAVVLHSVGQRGRVEHFVAVPQVRAAALTAQLRQAVPDVLVEACDPPSDSWDSSWVIWMSNRRRPLNTTNPESLSAGILSALSHAHGDEAVALRWVLGPVRRPIAVPTKANTGNADSWQQYLPVGIDDLDNEARTALLKKQGEPGWRAAGRLLVRATTTTRQRQLLVPLSAALRAAQGSGVQIGAHRSLLRSRRLLPVRRPLTLNVPEMTGLAGWPMGEIDRLPIDRLRSRPVAPAAAVPTAGRPLGKSTYPGVDRPVAISVKDSLSHGWLVGPTGSGKSELLARLAATDAAAGRSLVVLDPKGDLANLVLTQIPPDRQRDVVVIDVADDGHPLVGLNPLRDSRRNPELVADQLLGLFRSLSGEAWGPRVNEVMHAALLTIAQTPNANLCLLPFLLSDEAYRRQVLARIDDPFGLTPFWRGFGALSNAERQQAVTPVLRRLRQLLLRPRMRAVLGQTHPRFELNELFTTRRILVVNLAKGLVGPESSALLGSLVVSQLWQTILGRAAVAPEKRHPVMVSIDEVQDQVHGITDVGDMLSQARGLGVSLFVAHQNLGQIDNRLRAALAVNARSRIVWQTAYDDAAFFTRGQAVISAEDIQQLPQFHAFAQVLADGHVTPYASIRTTKVDPAISDPEELRRLSRERYGIKREDVEAELRAVLTPEPLQPAAFGVRRRTS